MTIQDIEKRIENNEVNLQTAILENDVKLVEELRKEKEELHSLYWQIVNTSERPIFI